MGKVYYIENLDKYIKNDKKEDNAHINIDLAIQKPLVLGTNLIEIDNKEKLDYLIRLIRKTDLLEDEQIHEIIKINFPELEKHTKGPVDIIKFKEQFKEVFSDIPDELFEDTNLVKGLRKILEFIIKKNEIKFTLENIANGRLLYENSKYRYTKQYAFYFRLMKLNHDLPEYYHYVINMQEVMERIFLREIVFGDIKDVQRKDLEMFRQIHNVIGKNMVDFRSWLQKFKNQILEERRLLKRWNITLPRDYWSEEENLLKLIENLLKDIDIRIEKTRERKEKIMKYIEDKKIFKKENIQLILDMLGIGGWFK